MKKEINEIKGVKFEVDLTAARKITEFRIGDNVKVLKKRYSDTFESHYGVVIGFDAFKMLPTVIVAYLDIGYQDANSKDVEIAPCVNDDHFLKKEEVLTKFDIEEQKKLAELEDIRSKRNYFLRRFNTYFEPKPIDSDFKEVDE